jgi:REP element-mobilizing transposase RayT
MPNHLHIIWEMCELNGKEMPYASFNKYTSHQFLQILRNSFPEKLINYQETDIERKHRFWQRDPLAILMDSKNKAEQKPEYIHLNPLQERWNLVIKPEDYKWSSAKFYETGMDEFKMITDYRERF